MTSSTATLKSYLDQWSEYFEGTESEVELLARLRNFAFGGYLRSCKFRSICWRVFLKCLPGDTGHWKEVIKKSRNHYVEVKGKHVTNPTNAGKDLSVENPLSQNDQSSWKKYFKNTELKKTIERDVKRTFPEMEYFHDEKVHRLLVDVLFCYAQEHSELSYRQGMHELLAPLVFIIHCDLQAACHGREYGALTEAIDLVLDETYIEHDAYDMFCHLMESTNPWYSVTESPKKEAVNGDQEAAKKDSSQPETVQAQPFQPQEIATSGGSTLEITCKLNHIHNTLLVQHDLQLHTHLNRLEIIPQVFGLRWIRLLFGREFSLQDLLVLWDAMFADSSTLDLVDYLFVAMLIHIRHILLNADYSTCMQILMKYPPVDDINDVVQAAMSIRRLKGHSFSDSFKENVIPDTAGSKFPASERSRTVPISNGTRQNPLAKMFKDFRRKVASDNRPVPPVPSHLYDPTYAGHVASPRQVQSSDSRSVNGNLPFFTQFRSNDGITRGEEMSSKHSLEEHVALLQQELDRMKQMCMFCSDKIDACVTVLQSSISITSDGAVPDQEQTSDNLVALPECGDAAVTSEQQKFEKEQILVTVASLKQTRDLLKGTLSFNPNLREYRSKRAKSQGTRDSSGEESTPQVVNANAEVADT